jgi:Iron-sulfur cluster-binding domain
MATLEITTKIGCRNNCAYCPQDLLIGAFSRKKDRRYLAYAKENSVFRMGLDMFRRCVDKVPTRVDIHFTGMCEPWLNPACTDMLLYAHDKGHRITASTTLVGIAPEDIEAMSEVPFKTFWVHLPSADGQERIRIDTAYLNLVKAIAASGIRVQFHYHGTQVHPAVRPIVGEPRRVILSSRGGNLGGKNIFSPEKRNPGRITCARNLQCNVLLPSGDVLLCCNDYGMQHVLGNLVASDYSSLFRGEEFIKVKKGLMDESIDILCRYCDVDVMENRVRAARGKHGNGADVAA